MKITKESLKRIIKEELEHVLGEMKFDPMGMGQMNPSLSIPDYILAGAYAKHLTSVTNRRGLHPAVNAGSSKHVVNSGKERREADREYNEIINNILKNQGVEGIPQQIKDDVEAGKYDTPHPDYVEPEVPRGTRGYEASILRKRNK